MAAEQQALEPATDAELHALWRTGILCWLMKPQQIRIYNVIRSLPLHVQIIVLLLARQFGKSVLSVLIAMEDCIQNPGVIVSIIAPKVDQAVDIVAPRMKWLTKTAPKGLIRPLKAENAWIFKNESELKLGGYSSGATSSRGKTLHKVFLEEFGPDTDADGYLDFIRGDVGPALIHSKNAQIIFPTTLPKVPDHPFITETIPEAELHGAFFKFTIDDNEMLTAEQKAQAIKLAGGRTSIECRRELFCEIVRDPLLVVVPAYEQTIHCRNFELPQYRYMHVTGDQGGTRDKSVWLLHSYDFYQDIDLICDELVMPPNTPFTEMVTAAREKWGKDVGKMGVLSTPDGHGFTVALDAPPRQLVDMTAFGFHASLVPKDDWQAGVNQMAVRFSERGKTGMPKVLLHPRTKFLQLSCRSGVFNKQRNDFARTESLGHCDALAALMYALRTQNRLNPWPDHVGMSRNVVQPRRAPSEKERIATAIQPKTFGPKPFGGPKKR